jgi:hypothetical protein
MTLLLPRRATLARTTRKSPGCGRENGQSTEQRNATEQHNIVSMDPIFHRRELLTLRTETVVTLVPKLSFSFVNVKDEVLKCYEQIFDHRADLAHSVEKVLDTLTELKKPSVQHDRKVFDYVLKHLFSEIECFRTYTAEALNRCAHLFGVVIEHGLIYDFEALRKASAFVLEALKEHPYSEMYNFGTTALIRFRYRLWYCPQYCISISKIPHFKTLPTRLIVHVERSLEARIQPLTKSADIKRLQESFVVTQLEEREETFIAEASAIDSKPAEIESHEQVVATVVPSSDVSAGLAACAESVEGTIASLMALPFTPTKTHEDDYAE